jgi:GxxExxY protein
MTDLILKDESYELIGICMEVHRELGMGFREIIYKDALEYEFQQRDIPYERERPYLVRYKSITLPRRYNADFIVFDSIILEVKASTLIVDGFVKQTINYLKASNLQLGIIANFGQNSFVSKRVIF